MNENLYTTNDANFWKIVFSLSFASFFVFGAIFLVHPLMPIFVERFNVSVSSTSLTLTLTIIGLIIGVLGHGFWSDRIGRTIFIKLSIAGSVIPFLIVPLFDSFHLMLILRFFQGITLAAFPATALAYMSEEISRASIGLATALYIGSNALGGMTGRFVTGFIVEQNSWQLTFYVWATVGIIALFLLLLLLPNSRFFTPIYIPVREDINAYINHLQNPSLLILFIMGVVLQLSFTGMWTYLSFYLVGDPFSLSLKIVSFFYLAYGLGIVGSSFANMLTEKLPLDLVRIFGIIVMSIGVFLTLKKSLFFIIVGLSFACLGFFAAHSLTATAVNVIATHHKGTASSLYLATYYVGTSMGSTVMAPVWDYFQWFGVIIVAGVLPLIYMVIQILFTRRRSKVSQKVG